MNSTSILVGVICGLIAAVLFLSPLSLGAMGVAMSSFTAMPLFIAVLGFGTYVGILAGVISAACVAIFLGPVGAASVLCATLAPALWIGHSAGLSRDDNGVREWFPVSQILFRLAMISALIVITVGILTGYSSDWAIQQSKEIMQQISGLQQQAGDETVVLDQTALDARARDIASLIPFMMPVSILLLMVINLRLAERFVRARDWMLRPKDDLPASVNLPVAATGVFLLAVALSFLDSQTGVAAKVVAGAFGCAFLLVGLATIHFVSRGWSSRILLLAAVYLVLILSFLIAPLLAVLGVAESLFNLRSRLTGGPRST